MKFDNEAVSPVVGVMLMLVVTIIIAAVVSGFAGGMAGGQKMAPVATLEAEVNIEDIEDSDTATWGPQYTDPVYNVTNGIVFEHKGGEALDLNDIELQLKHSDVSMIVTAVDELPDSNCVPPDFNYGGYFWKIANTGSSDTTISAGDKFIVYADNCYISGTDPYLLWTFDTGYGYGAVGDIYEYAVLDRESGKTISSGKFVLE